MVFDVSVAISWILFLALFPITFFWLRRAWRIAINKDFSEVAVKRGQPPANPARYAPTRRSSTSSPAPSPWPPLAAY